MVQTTNVTPCIIGHRGRKVRYMQIPNQLSREAIDEFKAIYKEEFGEELSDGQVQEIAIRLLRFFGILVKPTPSEDAV